jgi:hypothetical protein
MKQAANSGLLNDLLFNREDGGDLFLRKVSRLSADYTTLYRRRYNSSFFGTINIGRNTGENNFGP